MFIEVEVQFQELIQLAVNDIVQIALDADNNFLYFGVNGGKIHQFQLQVHQELVL